MASKRDEEVISYLKLLVEKANDEDRWVRENQLREWRRLKLYWDNFQRLYFDSVAHDWRQPAGTEQDTYYDKPINVLRAYLETIIAALSITVPPVKCVPGDANNSLDVMTARAADNIAKIIYEDNNIPILWMRGLFILCTEGLICAYNYSKSDKKFGTYKDEVREDDTEEVTELACPNCDSTLIDDNFCPTCMEEVIAPVERVDSIPISRLKEIIEKPKSRPCVEMYGGLNVKIPVYAKKPEDIGYLRFSREVHYSDVRDKYDVDIEGGFSDADNYLERWARTPTAYNDTDPEEIVTESHYWFRPKYYRVLDRDKAEELRKEYPNGVKVVMADDVFCLATGEDIDEHWTFTVNPLSDFLHHEPLGNVVINVQDIVNDMVALVLQTVEHGIPQTFADPSVLNFGLYQKSAATPGMVFPAVPKQGRSLQESFYEVKTATLSRETEILINRILELGQFVSGALPSLFGGTSQGTSKTASEYSMSRTQAQQRVGISWKMFTVLWKEIFGKLIPDFIKNMQEDEQHVQEDNYGNYINIYIKKSETQGRIGRIKLESADTLPVTLAQKKDAIMELMQTQHPIIMESLTAPENVGLLREIFGVPEFTLPNQHDIEKQQEEIQLLLESSPMPSPDGMMETSSVAIDQEIDNHVVEAEVCRRWAVSPAGRQAKIENPEGYRNVLLHGKEHMMSMQPTMSAPDGSQPPNRQPEQLPIPEVEDVSYGGPEISDNNPEPESSTIQ